MNRQHLRISSHHASRTCDPIRETPASERGGRAHGRTGADQARKCSIGGASAMPRARLGDVNQRGMRCFTILSEGVSPIRSRRDR